jgi:predicted transcriptional regulator
LAPRGTRDCVILSFMMTVLQKAIERVKALPRERQEYAAEVLEQIAAGAGGVFVIPEEDRAGVEEGLAQAARGELLDEHEVDAKLRRAWN